MLWDICKSFAILYFRLLFLSHSLITKLGTTSQLTIRLPRYDPKGQNINTQFTREFEEKCAKEFGENSLQTTVYRKMTHSKRIRWESFYDAISQRGTTIRTLTWRTQIVYNATDNLSNSFLSATNIFFFGSRCPRPLTPRNAHALCCEFSKWRTGQSGK